MRGMCCHFATPFDSLDLLLPRFDREQSVKKGNPKRLSAGSSPRPNAGVSASITVILSFRL
jgi:hypothetical protein